MVVADFAAEDVAGELLEVATGDDGLVGAVHGVELAAARPEEEHVGDEHRAGEDGLATLLVDAREPVGGGEVVPLEHLLAQRHELRGPRREEAGRHEEHAEPVGSEQIEPPAKEVVVGHLFAVGAVGVLRDRRAADAVGRVADDQPQPARGGGALLAHPPLERSEHPRGELGPLHGVPGDPGNGLERTQEATDARRGFEGVDGVAIVRKARHQRGHEAGDLLRDIARGVEFLREFRFA